MNNSIYQKKNGKKCIHGCIWVYVCSVTVYFLQHIVLLLHCYMRVENRIARFPLSFHSLGFVVPMPVLLELSVGARVCVQRRCTGWSGFFSYKNHHKNQTNKWDFFVVYASSKLQSRSLRLKILCFSV